METEAFFPFVAEKGRRSAHNHNTYSVLWMKSAWFARLPFTVHGYPLYYRIIDFSYFISSIFFPQHNIILIYK